MEKHYRRNSEETLSVLMAVYNQDQADYLNRALQSVWDDQTLRPDQIVLVEDGPLNTTLEHVISQWKVVLGDRLCLCKNEKNEGLTKCLNIGLRHVNTTFVARMDSDDISAPCRFEQQMCYLREHPEIDIVGGSIQEFNSDCACLHIRHYPLTHDSVVRYLPRASPLSHPAVMMRMRIFREGLSYNEKFPTSQDIALWFDAVTKGFRIGNIDEVVIYYRRENAFYKRRSRAKARNECVIYLRGIYRLKGIFTLSYIYPLARFCFRLLPLGLVKAIYDGRIRDLVLNIKSRERVITGIPTGMEKTI